MLWWEKPDAKMPKKQEEKNYIAYLILKIGTRKEGWLGYFEFKLSTIKNSRKCPQVELPKMITFLSLFCALFF